MKGLLVSGLLAAIAIGLPWTAAYAQANASDPATSVRIRSAPLVTQPASINRSQKESGSGRSTAPYTTNQLNSILGILEANPKSATLAPTNSIESLIKRFSTSTPKQTTIDPIDFFKPPALNSGFKIPLQQ